MILPKIFICFPINQNNFLIRCISCIEIGFETALMIFCKFSSKPNCSTRIYGELEFVPHPTIGVAMCRSVYINTSDPIGCVQNRSSFEVGNFSNPIHEYGLE